MTTETGRDRSVVATVLHPSERARVDAAIGGALMTVHRDSVGDALRVVRERPVDAVLVSVHRVGARDAADVRRLVRTFPGVPAVALLSGRDLAAHRSLLHLGASGVRDVVDVSSAAGWSELRTLLAEPVTRPAARILGPVLERLPGLPSETRLFLETMVRRAPSTPTVRQLARLYHVQSSTLMSRFSRVGLPSAKNYLASLRLLYAAQDLEHDGLSIADVAYRLQYSSPQSFGRHVRSLLGITGTEFRRRFPFPVALERFGRVMLDPYATTWRSFHPLGREVDRAVLPDPLT